MHNQVVARTFTLWVGSCSHVGTDILHQRESLADALRQSEGQDGAEGFPWDMMIDLGDLSGSQVAPADEEGAEVVRQYSVLQKHSRSQIYNVCGNHDASIPGEPTQWWFQKYGDPLGEHSADSGVSVAERPFPVAGAWDHYVVRAGNLVMLLMSDRNDGGPPVGRGPQGGYPAGAVTGETFDWWTDAVEANQDSIVISAHHHMLKETTVGSGPWEGFGARDKYGRFEAWYHGYRRDGGPMGAGYLYFVDGNPDAQAFERYLAERPGRIDLWVGGHTHTNPEDIKNGRSHVERKWDVTFVQCAALAGFHAAKTTVPMSRVFTFTEGQAFATIRCYLHSTSFANQGWYPRAERRMRLRHPFQMP